MTQAERNRLLLGQRIAVGFDGYELTPSLEKLIRDCKIGNIILFRRNIRTARQVRSLCDNLQKLILQETGLPAFIMLDEEGGTVSRLADIATPTPSAMAVGASGEAEYAYQLGRMMGGELSAVGVNMDLAPVLDCNTNPNNVVIGVRSFGSNPETVARFGARFASGLRQAGVIACGKHFPGHGDTEVDSHLGLPVVEKTMEQMEKEELVSFRKAISDGIDALMTAHVVFPALDANRVPSTVSRRVITWLLRGQMGYPGLIISDCMEMGAVQDLYGTPQAALMALQAGVDITLVSHTEALQRESFQTALAALESGLLNAAECQASYNRIVEKKQRLAIPAAFDPKQLRQSPFAALVQKIEEAAVRVLHAPAGRPLPALSGHPLFAGVDAMAASRASDGLHLSAVERLAQAFGGEVSKTPWQQEAQLLASAPGRTAVVVLSRHPDAQAMADFAIKLAQAGAQVIAVSMDTPYCLDRLPDSLWKIATYQYDDLALNRLIALLSHHC